MGFIKFLFSFVFVVILAGASTVCGYMFNKYSTDEKIKTLTKENTKLVKENNELYQNIEDLQLQVEQLQINGVQTRIKEDDEEEDLTPKKRINDIQRKREKCVNSSEDNDTKKQCYYNAADSWTKEIKATLTSLKKEMRKGEFDMVEYSQQTWEENKSADEKLVDKFIKNHDGKNLDDMAASVAERTEENRAEFLNKLYSVYTDQY